MIAEHKGRIVKTTGDGILIEFLSVVEAVACAAAMQQEMAKRNADVPAERRIEFRVGIHQGDIIVEDGDIFGDGVNVAARLEGIAEPGGICVSARVHEDTAGRLDLGFEDMGSQELKNIARAIQVFRVRPPSLRLNPAPQAQEQSTRGWWLKAEAAPALALPDKPSVAVLPFANMSSDPEQEFLADGIAEDVITALSRYPSLFVIARNSSFTYKGRTVEVRQVGRELGVRYVLEGSLRKSGNRIRVTAQLVEAATGNHVWAERYDRDLADIFAVQDEISEAVTIAISPAIADVERQRAMRKPPESLDAWAAYQRGLWHFGKGSASDNLVAEEWLQRATSLDPTFAGGYWGLALAQIYSATAFQRRSLAEAQGSAEALARRAVSLDSADAQARACLGWMLLHRGDHPGALAELELSLSMSPNLASAHGVLGHTLNCSGRPKEGVASLMTAVRLDPRDPTMAVHLNHLAVGLYFSGEYEKAIEVAARSIRLYPDFPLPYRWLAAALGQLGRTSEAEEALDRAIAVQPVSFDTYVRVCPPWFLPKGHEHLLEGLRKAGWGATSGVVYASRRPIMSASSPFTSASTKVRNPPIVLKNACSIVI
jgi:adenylate cyclase